MYTYTYDTLVVYTYSCSIVFKSIFILSSSNENDIVLDNTISLPGRRRRLGRRSGVGAGWGTCFVPGPKSDLNWFAPNQRNRNFSGSRLTGQT